MRFARRCDAAHHAAGTGTPRGAVHPLAHACRRALWAQCQAVPALDVLAATYLRNSGSVSLCLLGCAQAGTEDLGQEPPTALQIEAMAQASAALAAGLHLPIDIAHVMTHGEAADNEDGLTPHAPYGPKHGCERWDLEYLGTAESPCFNPWASGGTRGGDVLRGKALWYQELLWR